ncbi:hypothetical protein HYC85_020362 [Camellia sinensis]|uniref:Apple domain-containing protein n=1 Tax=Camellia sinensis TaxID=4442 RepID=A0A7J7GPT5_CAMSI|nr:hypothetical protein HYC85_020362 [Camellia sinensis]
MATCEALDEISAILVRTQYEAKNLLEKYANFRNNDLAYWDYISMDEIEIALKQTEFEMKAEQLFHRIKVQWLNKPQLDGIEDRLNFGGVNLFGGSTLSIAQENGDVKSSVKVCVERGDGNLVLYPLNTKEASIDAYWASDTWHELPNSLLLNHSTGILAYVTRTLQNKPNTHVGHPTLGQGSSLDTIKDLTGDDYNNNNNNNKTIIYRATLDFDGVFRLYSHKFDQSANESQISIEWKALENPCEVKGFCGLNSFCTLDDYRPYCICLPDTNFIDLNKWSMGCGRNFSKDGCTDGIENTATFNITTMEQMLWGEISYANEEMSIEDCKKSCLEDCNCEAAMYVGRSCKKQSLPLKYVRRDISGSTAMIFLKVAMTRSIIKSKNVTDPLFKKPTTPPPRVLVKSKEAVMLVLLVTIGLLTSSFAALAISGIYVYKFKVLKYKRLLQY